MKFLREDLVFSFLYSLSRQFIPEEIVIFLGSYLVFLVTAFFLFLIWRESSIKKRLFLLNFFLLAEVLSRGILVEVIRFFYNRPRPFLFLGVEPLISHSPSPSLPSGHAAFAFTLALVAFLIDKKKGWFFLLAAFLVSIGRILAALHWLSDILASLIVSFLSFLVVYYLFLPLKKRIYS